MSGQLIKPFFDLAKETAIFLSIAPTELQETNYVLCNVKTLSDHNMIIFKN